jgi:hypothetical protein
MIFVFMGPLVQSEGGGCLQPEVDAILYLRDHSNPQYLYR